MKKLERRGRACHADLVVHLISSLFPKLHLGTPLSAKLCFPLLMAMRSRYRIHGAQGVYFVTSTLVAWLPVFTTAERCNIIVESLEYCRLQKGLKVYAWVILDNHVHAILEAPDLIQVLTDFKRHVAQQLLERLQTEGCEWLLNQFQYFRSKHKIESKHQVWQEGVHPQEITSDEMMGQKVDYIHRNPVRRGLVVAPEHWRYSSAHEWCLGATPVFRCDPWR